MLELRFGVIPNSKFKQPSRAKQQNESDFRFSGGEPKKKLYELYMCNNSQNEVERAGLVSLCFKLKIVSVLLVLFFQICLIFILMVEYILFRSGSLLEEWIQLIYKMNQVN